ncbi:hypothetical protein RUM43_002405 [Polyplax serrata]|uniref:Uncharacterized protein n=1 Tax=Polyplax serrata TaxID=468196 RepID=A0AAN8NUK6_POLSC
MCTPPRSCDFVFCQKQSGGKAGRKEDVCVSVCLSACGERTLTDRIRNGTHRETNEEKGMGARAEAQILTLPVLVGSKNRKRKGKEKPKPTSESSSTPPRWEINRKLHEFDDLLWGYGREESAKRTSDASRDPKLRKTAKNRFQQRKIPPGDLAVSRLSRFSGAPETLEFINRALRITFMYVIDGELRVGGIQLSVETIQRDHSVRHPFFSTLNFTAERMKGLKKGKRAK